MKKTKLLIIIVSYNSKKHLQWAISGLSGSRLDIDLSIVDSGSVDTAYIDDLNFPANINVFIRKETNIGFVAGNNLALSDVNDYDYILYLNPDARIEAANLDRLIEIANDSSNGYIGAFTVPLIRFNIDTMSSMNIYDSVGIKCNVWGRWYDYCANEPVTDIINQSIITLTEGICGAFMLVRSSVLSQALDSTGQSGLERSFYMYKEDIELSCRIISKGYKLGVVNDISAFHCRGWQGKRPNIPYWARYQSAKNDIFVAVRYKKRALPFSCLKYIFVRFFEKKS